MGSKILDNLKSYANIIDAELDKVGKRCFLEGQGSECISEYADRFIECCKGGKHIRSYLVKLGYEMVAGRFDSLIILPSLSYEIFHTAALIQDDVFDQSPIRRNKKSLYVTLGNDDDAKAIAVCIGDMGIVMAMELLIKTGIKEECVLKALANQAKVFKFTILGEMQDIYMSKKQNEEVDQILDMYYLKTAWYTFIGPLEMGAIFAGADREVLEQIEEIGKMLGIIYQIQDDINGVFSDEQTIGKSTFSDMREGKNTILSNYLLKEGMPEVVAEFQRIYGKKDSGENELHILRQLFRESGSLENAKGKVAYLLSVVKDLVREMKIVTEKKEEIVELISYIGGLTGVM